MLSHCPAPDCFIGKSQCPNNELYLAVADVRFFPTRLG